ncbi:hypothetical protein H4683_003363 [Filibacter limicola]|uniref:Uncharacterized protein n=1 Tax=Sporosarcina limicola TaxID=34101 RepID=A0A927MKW0_9BACL|nr:hypothetical protein [Sporosarcina limicola]
MIGITNHFVVQLQQGISLPNSQSLYFLRRNTKGDDKTEE